MVTDRTRAELEEAKAACAQAERELRQAHARLEAAHQRLGDVTQQWIELSGMVRRRSRTSPIRIVMLIQPPTLQFHSARNYARVAR